jgi:hypothetical protein
MGFQQRCLHTSCCVVQLRLQVPAVALDPGTTVRVEAVVGTQEFRQVIATVSQLIWHVVVVVLMLGAVSGTGLVT